MQTAETEPMQKLTELVKDIRIAMITTVEEDGTLHSRPMATQDIQEDTLWFFLNDDSRKAHAVVRDARVNVSYVDSNTWVSVSGSASISRDQSKIDELWKEGLRAWFPEGKAEPHLALMKVQIQEAEYWDVGSSSMVRLFGYLKAKLTGEPHEGGLTDHQVVGR